MFPPRIPRSAQSSCLNTRAREGTRERVKGARGEGLAIPGPSAVRQSVHHSVRPFVRGKGKWRLITVTEDIVCRRKKGELSRIAGFSAQFV